MPISDRTEFAGAALELHLPDTTLVAHPRLNADYGLCPKTGVVYYLKAKSKNYEGDYFLSEYSAQYGRTYLEDEPHLRTLARRRLTLLAAARNATGAPGRLFEIGCATGFFLDEGRRAGYQVSGLEISEFAANHGRSALGLDISTASFVDAPLATAAYDVIAAFYVIEHFAAQRSVFAKIARALRPGGAFVFALPSIFGPLFEYDPPRWIQTHPDDHFADYGPASLRRVLELYGLRLVSVRPAAYHPTRARGLKGSRVFRPLYRPYADWRGYGDTLEGVAVRVSAAPVR